MAFNLGGGLAAMAGGAAAVAGNQIKNNQNIDMERELIDLRAAKQTALEIAKEARVRATNTADLADIRSRSDASLSTNTNNATEAIKALGVGGSVDAESLAALQANPQALATYRKAGATGLLNPNRQQQAEADTQSALDIGRTDYADKYESVAKGARAERKQDDLVNKEQNRHEETVARELARDKVSQRNFDRQMTQAMSVSNRQFKSDSNAQDRAKISALQSTMREYGDLAKTAMLNSKSDAAGTDPKLAEYFKGIYDDNNTMALKISKTLVNYGETGSIEQPKINADDPLGLFDTSNPKKKSGMLDQGKAGKKPNTNDADIPY